MKQLIENSFTPEGIELHSEHDFEGMRRAGHLAAEVLDMITGHVSPGISTEDLDTLCHDYIIGNGAIPAPLNYQGAGPYPFPKSICTSVNHVVCHGIPGEKKLREGDIINIDVTVILDGWHGDTSRMYLVGEKVPVKARRLVDVTYDAMMAGIATIRAGSTLGDIGAAIQTHVEAERFSVVRDYCGHGLGRVFHAPPSVMHYGQVGAGTILQPGMFFTVEPMINAGNWQTKLQQDGWTAVTKDFSLSAQFEHSIGVTETGCEIFTLSPRGFTKPPYNNA
ncbi:MAG: type I methionyl aminopeptidase [Alphaproteobacteria bacterium]|nr:type I methionyl aminopeptidase [Alphaproteobacteria bacterium]